MGMNVEFTGATPIQTNGLMTWFQGLVGKGRVKQHSS